MPGKVSKVRKPAAASPVGLRRDSSVAALKQSIMDHLVFTQARSLALATRNDWYMALSFAIRDRMLDDWVRSLQHLHRKDLKIVSYLSAEFLMGPHLGNNLINLGLMEPARAAVAELGQNLDDLIGQEEEPGLGNGGLGRLAACYMDSMATLRVPAIGYGIRYEFGIFDQEIRDGWQVERTDRWLRHGNPWEVRRYEIEHPVGFGGHTELVTDAEAMRVFYLERFHKETTMIAYGAYVEFSERPELISPFGVTPDNYYLIASRLIPENHADLIAHAFLRSGSPKKLVIAGGANYDSPFHRELRSLAGEKIILTGHINDQEVIKELHCNCFAYVHGHSVGGTNPSLLKAMGYGNCILALDTVFNREVLADGGIFFPRDETVLAGEMQALEAPLGGVVEDGHVFAAGAGIHADDRGSAGRHGLRR